MASTFRNQASLVSRCAFHAESFPKHNYGAFVPRPFTNQRQMPRLDRKVPKFAGEMVQPSSEVAQFETVEMQGKFKWNVMIFLPGCL